MSPAPPERARPEQPVGDEPAPASRPAPTWTELSVANLKVVGGLLALALVCWLLWRGLAALFPGVAWLQPPG